MSSIALGPLPPPPAPSPSTVVEEFHVSGETARALYADHDSLRPIPGGGDRSAPVRKFVDARQWVLPGTYMLLWPADSLGRIRVYVGGTGDLLGRLATQPRAGWSHAIALTTQGLTIGGAFQLEQGLGKVLCDADPGQASFVPDWHTHPALSLSDMPLDVVGPVLVLAERVLHHVGVLSLSFDPKVALR